MSSAPAPPPPPLLEQRPDGLWLTVPGTSLFPCLHGLLALVTLSIGIGLLGLFVSLNWPTGLEFCVVWVVIFLLANSWRILRELGVSWKLGRHGTVHLSADRLEVAVMGALWQRRWSWARTDVMALYHWNGLHIVGRNGQLLTVFAGRPGLAPLIGGLYRGWEGPDECLAEHDELPVTYTGTFWDEPYYGNLSVRPGMLVLRHRCRKDTYLVVRTAPGVWRNYWWHRALTVTPSDAVCRLDPDGAAHLEIAPADVRCTTTADGVPLLKIALLPGITLKLHAGNTRKPSGDPVPGDFFLTIRCTDDEALERAWARFWSETNQA